MYRRIVASVLGLCLCCLPLLCLATGCATGLKSVTLTITLASEDKAEVTPIATVDPAILTAVKEYLDIWGPPAPCPPTG